MSERRNSAMTIERQRAKVLSLPLEVIDSIASIVAPPDFPEREAMLNLHSNSLVCKAFHVRFRPFVFRSISVNDRTLKRFAALLLVKHEIGAYVRVIECWFPQITRELELAETFSRVACQLTNLRRFYLETDSSRFFVAWKDTCSAFRKGFTSIITSPSLVFMRLSGNTIFSIPHRLLFSAGPALKTLEISDDESDLGHRNWKELDESFAHDAEDEQHEFPSVPQSRLQHFELLLHGQTNWIDYLSTQPHLFANLTDLTIDHNKEGLVPSVQTFLEVIGAQLQHLELIVYLPKPFFDLSSNTGLQSLDLYCYSTHDERMIYPLQGHNGLPTIENILSTLNCPLLNSLLLHVDWRCPGQQRELQRNFPRAPLRELDSLFVEVARRQPSLREVYLSAFFAHSRCATYPLETDDYVPCGISNFWDCSSPDIAKSTREDYFPFLGLAKPEALQVFFLETLNALVDVD